MQRIYQFLLFLILIINSVHAQNDTELHEAVGKYFTAYRLSGYSPRNPMRADSSKVDNNNRTLLIYANESFCSQLFTPESVTRIYKDLKRQLPSPYNNYHITISDKKGRTIEDFIPNTLRTGNEDRSRLWEGIDYTGQPWVTNISRPYKITHGLANRHLVVNASHGRYYKEGRWLWQRPFLFCTAEDLLTQSFVFPYIIPMLENAGAIVFTARERDIQTAEAVVDNDAKTASGIYEETSADKSNGWSTVDGVSGFATLSTVLNDSIEPFLQGTVRQISAVAHQSRLSQAAWIPTIPRTGRYAVYVSYASLPNSVPDAHYTVFHKGGSTHFIINQQFGGGTWVYLGTFDFNEGTRREGCVVLSNQSNFSGVVTADGVRFGGGMGQTSRETSGTSAVPRFLESARYQAQWSGLPDSLFRRGNTSNDYNDDLRSRSYLTNNFGGGSIYMNGIEGKGIPFELSLAVHSDAGVNRENGIYGTLAICTTVDGLGATTFPPGMSRKASHDFAATLLNTVSSDLSKTFSTTWTQREIWDRNYAETRTPDVPSAILEMFSHQNFTDMKYAHDPTFKFFMSRAVYKAILRYVNNLHSVKDYAVQPLPPHAFAARLTENGMAELSWQPTEDPLEPSARPSAYVVYTKTGDGGFDNGKLIEGGVTRITFPVNAGTTYAFKVTAVNQGGESFPSEILSLRRAQTAVAKQILIVNGFDRLSGPAWVERNDSLGFDLDEDLGVAYGYATAFSGRQFNFNAASTAEERTDALGYSGTELTGKILAGNTFNYPLLHGQDIAAAGDYSFSSCSREALLNGSVNPENYHMIDYICGLQRDVPHNLFPYKTFDRETRQLLTRYLHKGGSLLVSGSYIGCDLMQKDERRFATDVLKYIPAGTARSDSTTYVRGLNLVIPIRRTPSAEGYAVTAPDVILPSGKNTFSAFAYGGGLSAGTAYAGHDYRVIAMGFPFESITESSTRGMAMGAIIRFLTDK